MSKVPTEKREQVLAELLQGLEAMFGDVYDDYKDEHEATYNNAAARANRTEIVNDG